jgi:hypothetical protein
MQAVMRMTHRAFFTATASVVWLTHRSLLRRTGYCMWDFLHVCRAQYAFYLDEVLCGRSGSAGNEVRDAEG